MLTFARVDLDALGQNVRTIRAIAGSALLMAVVKSCAYGHGAVEVAQAAIEAGADWLGVYTAEEGAQLRAHGIDAPILVFGPITPRGAADIVVLRLTPTVTSPESARLLHEATGGGRLGYHLKVDTGLTRSGVLAADAATFVESLSRFPGLELAGVYTHLACADDPSSDVTSIQLKQFDQVVEALEQRGFEIPLKHTANTAATLNFPSSRYDMVRVGIGLYGYDPSSSEVKRSNLLYPVLSLGSRIVKLSHVPAGTGVGYGHAFRCVRPSNIALVPVGYGDGLLRCLGEGHGSVLVRGQRVPIVGRVSMDQITIDVTDVPASVGDPVTIIGQQAGNKQTADDVAGDARTISYELLCRLAPRVTRVYEQGGKVTVSSASSALTPRDADPRGRNT